MAWFNARWRELGVLLAPPHWGALAFCVAFALFWTRLGPKASLMRPAAWLGFAAGVLIFPLTVLWVQADIQKASHDLLTAVAGQETVDARPLLSGAFLSLTGAAAQEILKLLAILFVIFLLGYRRDIPTALSVGVAVALGYALFEGERFLTPVLNEGLTNRSASPLVRSLFQIGAHVGTGMVLARSWVDGKFVRYFLIAVILQAALSYGAVLQLQGLAHNGILAYHAAIALLAFSWGSAIAVARR